MAQHSEPIEEKDRGQPTADNIRNFVTRHPDLSTRELERGMRNLGYKVSASSILRCMRNGYQPLPWEKRLPGKRKKKLPDPKETAEVVEKVKQLRSVASEAARSAETLAGAVSEVLDKGDPEATKKRFDELLNLTFDQLAERATKVTIALEIVLKEELGRNTKTMMLMPDKAAELYKVLVSTKPFMLNGDALGPAMPAKSQPDGAKIIDHTPGMNGNGYHAPSTPLQTAIGKFIKDEGLMQ